MRSLTDLAESEDVTHDEHCETYAHYIDEYARRIQVLQLLWAEHHAKREEAKDNGTK